MKKMSLTLGTLALLMQGAHAQAPKDESFYKGKTISIIVGFTPGGSYDAYARMLARHMPQYIAGSPTIIVQNMPGGGTLTAVRYLDGNTPKDGTVLAAFTSGLITASIADPETVKYNFSDLGWVGSITRDFSVCYAWHATGITSLADAKARKEYIIGDTARGSSASINSTILSQMLGVKVRTIMGYTGSAESRIAIERGELEGHCGAWVILPQDWRTNKQLLPFVRFSRVALPDMPASAVFAGDVVTNDDDRKLIDFLLAPSEVGRPFVVSKLVPAERLATLRQAFAKTMDNKDFLSEADRQGLPVSAIAGEEAQKMVADIYQAPPALVQRGRAVLK